MTIVIDIENAYLSGVQVENCLLFARRKSSFVDRSRGKGNRKDDIENDGDVQEIYLMMLLSDSILANSTEK
ncbi:2914_t:CDS:2, partial [Cetraspora pellucida]